LRDIERKCEAYKYSESYGDIECSGSEIKDTGQARRIQAVLPKASAERLASLKDRSEANSEAEVIRNALRLYEELINEAENGSQFYIKPKDGEIVRFRIFAV
jgi:hypothetical protein